MKLTFGFISRTRRNLETSPLLLPLWSFLSSFCAVFIFSSSHSVLSRSPPLPLFSVTCTLVTFTDDSWMPVSLTPPFSQCPSTQSEPAVGAAPCCLRPPSEGFDRLQQQAGFSAGGAGSAEAPHRAGRSSHAAHRHPRWPITALIDYGYL